jgi:hypothetical protein
VYIKIFLIYSCLIHFYYMPQPLQSSRCNVCC